VRCSEVNKQDGLTERLGSCALRLNSATNVRDIARKMFECKFPWLDHCDPLVVDGAFSEVRVFYVCTKASISDQRTFVDCRFQFDSRQLWIGSMQVAACHRLKRVGRQLVKAAEATANALRMEEVRILPMPSAVDFWLKLHYTPDPRSARVLWNNLADV
jgi:GNAT superfamily N-acetyltransferase